jgi:hypothetical protein
LSQNNRSSLLFGCQLFCKLNMPNPSLQLHYRVFITTTIWSAANISDHPLSDCFLLRFYSTMLTSLVPYDSLCTVLANLTPVIMYPEIRSSDTLCRKHKRNCLLLITSIALTRLHHWFTFIQLLYTHLQLSMQPFFLNVQHICLSAFAP